ncbi:hypothetical protein CB0940_03356 [Cercospora beticola]|uniref:ASST-domain-containing protein n=1 Tax=Cercospora beticola TaxID=122368 RepID=A0A2G5I5J8_CERBT|nr:hypothetical protein CB0940_03356 [Cercospora beticola]PIB00039.1 hypothetical protein CB0940_03356 [Cercospora beticola]WPB00532.1 hypothetical protein RHO25_005152 [Cercospora beticola]CAK1361250.1 unnamed protein product [Cercospora beticola]
MSYPFFLTFLTTILTPCLADQVAFHADSQYNDGKYGSYVTQIFKSHPQVTAVPIVNFMKPFTSCDDGSYLFLAPRGDAADATPMILDVTGSPIWASTQKYGEVYNLQVQKYKNEAFLTFWGGNDAVGGHGIGTYFMLDQQYQERYRIEAANGLGADLHVFTITESGTALISIYDTKYTNLDSKVGYERQGWIWDSIFQVIDLETGEAVFEWRANDHIEVAQSYAAVNEAAETDPWDAYHLNSVEKDKEGNYLISCRYLRALIYIDGRTGDVLWQLGGHKNSFTDLSGGKATTFLGQHDAHFLEKDGKTFVTFFDNNADWDHSMDDQSKGTRIELDFEARTAKLDVAMYDPTTKILSSSQGSYQTLPNGHVVLGYGFNGAMAEFSEDGKLLCDAYFQPSSTFGTGAVQSYRNLRFNWTAYPITKPSLVFDEQTLYMSWNGATEVASWLLVDFDDDETNNAATDDNDDENVRPSRRSPSSTTLIPKSGFETEYKVDINTSLKRFLRVIALDSTGLPLGTSEAVDIGDLAAVEAEADSMEEEKQRIANETIDQRILIGFGGLAGLSVVLVLLWSFTRRRKAGYRVVGHRHQGSEEKENDRRGAFIHAWQHLRAKLPGRRDSGDDWGDLAAAEGLLTEEESRMIALQIPGTGGGYR